MDKREFLKITSGAIALSPFFGFNFSSKKSSSLNVLFLGGRGFIGPTIVENFLNAGHKITLVNRGKTNPHLFRQLNYIKADREQENKEGLKELKKAAKNTSWDIVIDTWQKSPKAVSDALEVLKGKFKHYHYISSVAVYKNWGVKNNTEESILSQTPPPASQMSVEYPYFLRKTMAEKAIMQLPNQKYTIYRSHGMRDYRIYDPIDEPYWPVRFHRGGDIMLPKAENHFCQVTDVVSLSNFILHAAENQVNGAYNVAYKTFTFKDYVNALQKVTKSEKNLIWIDGTYLKEEGIRPYKDIPLWKPEPKGAYHFNVDKALKNGLKNRPLEEMLHDQIEGYKYRNPNDAFKFGHPGTITRERELAVIKKWKERKLVNRK